MISKVRIQALKSIGNVTVDCSKLNLIVGINSAGKSTFLQALLLDAQYGADQSGLNGRLISLGDYREARNFSMPDSNIKIWIWKKENENPAWIEFGENADKTCRVRASVDPSGDKGGAKHLRSDVGFHYLSCHRLGPQDIYKKNFGGNDNLGVDGEYTFSYLLEHETDPVDRELIIDMENTADILSEQVNYWLNDIVGSTLSLSDIKKTNYLQVKYNNNPANTNSEALFCRPVNVGSGVSYLTSILITCLASSKEDIIIIENPEIHLHPKAQSGLCRFLYFVARSGRQLFVETHSDHIFNGIRAGIADKTISQEDVRVNFFSLDKNYTTQCNPITFGEYGKIIGAREDLDINDLFDQFEIDLDRMLGL